MAVRFCLSAHFFLLFLKIFRTYTIFIYIRYIKVRIMKVNWINEKERLEELIKQKKTRMRKLVENMVLLVLPLKKQPKDWV